MTSALIAASACDTHAETANAAINTPPIHVMQTSVSLMDGKPMEESLYKVMVERCGSVLRSKPLDEDTVHKLGRTYYDRYFRGSSMSVRADAWHLEGKGQNGCVVKAVHTSELTIVRPGKVIIADLIKGTAETRGSPGVRRESQATTPEKDVEEDSRRAKAMDALRSHGWDAAISQEAQSSSNGQPCRLAKIEKVGEQCVWSGGKEWGFNESGSASVDGKTDDSITLWARPTDGLGTQWATQVFTIGQPFGHDPFAVPDGVTMEATH